MMLYVVFVTLFVTAFCQNETKVAIVNSTNIEDVKVDVRPEERSGSVMYVYARSGSMDLPAEVTTLQEGLELNNGTKLQESVNETETVSETVSLESTNSTDNSTAPLEIYCVVRVEEDETIKYYEGTMEELRNMGKNVLDLLCEGDEGTDYKVLSRGALASLVGG